MTSNALLRRLLRWLAGAGGLAVTLVVLVVTPALAQAADPTCRG